MFGRPLRGGLFNAKAAPSDINCLLERRAPHHGPLLTLWQYADAAVVTDANQSVGTYSIINADELKLRVRLPVQRHVEVARKDLPFRPVVEFHKVTFGMRSDLHACQR
jgi:hypothetical protein